MLAGLLYLGAGLGLAVVHTARTALGIAAPEAPLRRRDLPWLFVIIIFGGILGPVLLMLGLGRTSASSGSLLLNLESLATMGIAWLVFHENVDRRLLLGAVAIILGAITLSWEGQSLSLDVGAAMIAGACICWGIDNNLTRKLSSADPVSIAMIKGLAAGTVNMASGFWLGDALPSSAIGALAALLGFLRSGSALFFSCWRFVISGPLHRSLLLTRPVHRRVARVSPWRAADAQTGDVSPSERCPARPRHTANVDSAGMLTKTQGQRRACADGDRGGGRPQGGRHTDWPLFVGYRMQRTSKLRLATRM